ncbi:hypothetical protein F4808DRAFT_418865 [Astrocystis sublimbata]|nr:hypothetical protein F4808DRAFT_418865 [Astrocystis sublimbata]
MVKREPNPEPASEHDPAVANPPRIEVWSATDSEVDSERIWGATDQTAESKRHNAAQQVPNQSTPGATAGASLFDQAAQNPWSDMDKSVALPAEHAPAPAKLDEVPEVLRPGVGLTRSETNPFKRKPLRPSESPNTTHAQTANGTASPGGRPSEPVILPSTQESPGHNANPWQPTPSGAEEAGPAHTAPSLLDQDLDSNIWGSNSKPVSPDVLTGHSQSTPAPGPASANPAALDGLLGHENAWEGEESSNKGKQPAVFHPAIPTESIDGWNMVEHGPVSEPAPGNLSRQSTWEDFVDDDTAKDVATGSSENAPALPPTPESVTHETEDAPPLPPALPPRTATANMSETYQIKNINWHDLKAAENPRKSPVLVQNANGPCPLVALVNALTLTTPADRSGTSLAGFLASREQVSLSFLLEVVVDELMSSRHTDANTPLPDMSELYSFLQGLHTGMNVNPRFIPAAEVAAAYKEGVAPQDHQPEGKDGIPGTFEKTRDMELYSTFKVPLIHGWLPPKQDPVYDALNRRATSYDDAQNLLFLEEELEAKFSNSSTGLTSDEQQLYGDITLIKSFLLATATQLTPSGLDVVTESIKPGEVSILFRNDHFSTLYRHPQTRQLFTLVTDAGFYTHDEVVWESLADVRGERTEFFSGDFRVVGGNQRQRSASQSNGHYGSSAAGTSSGGAWQTVQNRRSRNSQQNQSPPADPPLSAHEQEDRDMALALQLQEEEEERHRKEQAARRRERQLSEQYIEQQGRDGGRPNTRNHSGSTTSLTQTSTHGLPPPPRNSSTNQPARAAAQGGGVRPVHQQQVRSLIPPRTHRPPDDGLDDAPPSYEQVSKNQYKRFRPWEIEDVPYHKRKKWY